MAVNHESIVTVYDYQLHAPSPSLPDSEQVEPVNRDLKKMWWNLQQNKAFSCSTQSFGHLMISSFSQEALDRPPEKYTAIAAPQHPFQHETAREVIAPCP